MESVDVVKDCEDESALMLVCSSAGLDHVQLLEGHDVIIKATRQPAQQGLTEYDDKCMQIRSRAKSRNRPEQAKTGGRLREPRRETFAFTFLPACLRPHDE